MDRRVFVGDFETTVYAGQRKTEVWASALVEIGSETVRVDNCIDDTFEYLSSLPCNVIVYYHNLKFDGNFWLHYLLVQLGYTNAYYEQSQTWVTNARMPPGTVKYSISDRGQWYTITIRTENNIIEIRDSLKLLPFSVKRIGESFGTKRKKTSIEYSGYREAGGVITEEEKEYISNDVLVVKEALEIMFNEGHDKLTIGACCLAEYKNLQEKYDRYFPDLYSQVENSINIGEFIRKSYKGGWCYLVKGKENREFNAGVTADVNSLYPSMMHSESGNRYPIGKGYYWKGNKLDCPYDNPNCYYFVRIKTRFKLKDGFLPFIQIKGNPFYKGTECLESSDIKYEGEYYSYYEWNGEIVPARVELTLTCKDFELMKKHYDLFDFEIIDGVWFWTEIGIFDNYIDKYREEKETSKGAKREKAKLFLNNLYGKMATNTNSSFKLAYIKDDFTLGFTNIEKYDKKPGYIAVGSAITSYARCFTITAAQQNYYGPDKRGFIYADTDSIHADLSPEELKDVPVHPTAFCHWKLESQWDRGHFTRQKTYIEHIIKHDGEEIKPYYDIKCAGMPERCKSLLNASFRLSDGECLSDEELKKYTAAEIDYINRRYQLKDFTTGLCVPGKLLPKRIRGGIVLQETTYEMR